MADELFHYLFSNWHNRYILSVPAP